MGKTIENQNKALEIKLRYICLLKILMVCTNDWMFKVYFVIRWC